MSDDPTELDYGYSRRPEHRGLDDIARDDRVSEPARKEPRDATRQMKRGALEEIRDHQQPPVTRVKVGKLGDGVQDYGLEVRNASGDVVMSATGLGVDVVGPDQLQSGAVEFDGFASDLEPVDVVDNLPDPDGYSGPQTVLLTTDRKLYRYDPNAPEWTAAVPSTDLTGEIIETQIADDSISTPKLQANAVEADKIATGAVEAGKIDADAVVAGTIAAGAINATDLFVDGVIQSDKISVATLSEIVDDAGIIIDGELRNASGTRFIDLDATGNDPFIEHPGLSLQADGDAEFSGALNAASGSFAGSLDAASGTFAGSLSAVDGTFEGSLNAVDGSFSGSLTAALQQAQSLEIVADVEGDVGKNVEVQLGADTLTFFDTADDHQELRIWPDSNAVGGAQSISFRDDLVFSPFNAGAHMRYDSGTHGILPVAKTIVSTNTQSGSLEEGTLYIQVN